LSLIGTTQGRRHLKPAFEAALLSGSLQPLLRLVQRDRDLTAEIRLNLLDIYCRGQRLINVKPQGTGSADRVWSDKVFWPEEATVLTDVSDTRAFCTSVVSHIKQRIAEHSRTGKEIKFEQVLVRVNNLEPLNTDYIAVDRQGVAEGDKGCMDVTGVYWPGERRRFAIKLCPALIEVKCGLKWRRGGGSRGRVRLRICRTCSRPQSPARQRLCNSVPNRRSPELRRHWAKQRTLGSAAGQRQSRAMR
jgi:hypothetical protein